MKKNALKKAWVLFGVIIIFLSVIYAYITFKKRYTEHKLLNIANEIVNENVACGVQNNCVEQEQFSVQELERSDNVIGKLIIPRIEVEAPVKDGTSPDVLREAIGHFSSSSYWNGNVCLASHNRGTYAHYFEKINELNIGDEITYQTQMGTRIFKVESINVIDESDISVLKNTKNNYLTLITCVKNQPESRLCLKAIEKIQV